MDAVLLAAFADTSDPDTAEVTLFQLSAYVCVLERFHNLLVGNLIMVLFSAPIALSELNDLFSSFARHQRAFNSSHLSKASCQFLLVGNEALNLRFISGCSVACFTQLALSLGGLAAFDVMAAVHAGQFNFSAFCNRKALFCARMRLYFRHGSKLFSFLAGTPSVIDSLRGRRTSASDGLRA